MFTNGLKSSSNSLTYPDESDQFQLSHSARLGLEYISIVTAVPRAEHHAYIAGTHGACDAIERCELEGFIGQQAHGIQQIYSGKVRVTLL
jgi:hypothetical protein